MWRSALTVFLMTYVWVAIVPIGLAVFMFINGENGLNTALDLMRSPVFWGAATLIAIIRTASSAFQNFTREGDGDEMGRQSGHDAVVHGDDGGFGM